MSANDSLPVKASDIVTSLSNEAISRARMKGAFGHNMTKFPLAIGGLGLFGLVLFGVAWPIAVVAGVGVSVGLGNWFNQFVIRGHENTRAYIRQVKEQIRQAEEAKRIEVGPLLEECRRDNPEASDLINSALSQFRHVSASFSSFMDVLGRKLDSQEFTFGVYAEPAEQAALGVYDNLEQIVTILKAIGSIDVHELNERIRELEANTNRSQRQDGILQQLRERVKIFNDELAHIEQLILENSEAVTAIERVTTAISRMRTDERSGKYNHQVVLKELLKVADRSKSLGVKQEID